MKNLFRTFLVMLAAAVVLPLGGCAKIQKTLEIYGSLEKWEPLAEQGDAVAQNNLGEIYTLANIAIPRRFGNKRCFRLGCARVGSIPRLRS